LNRTNFLLNNMIKMKSFFTNSFLKVIIVSSIMLTFEFNLSAKDKQDYATKIRCN
jgi:hypothetical protein